MKAISSRKYLLLIVALAAGGCILIGLANWLVDPLQYYRRAAYPAEFSDETRYQNPGLARHYPYDTVIMGTSVSRGFDVQQMREVLGWDPLNLSMQGASAREQSLLLEVALRTGRVRRVLWDVNAEFLRGPNDWVSDYDGTFPMYLYTTDPLEKVPKYLLNIDTTKATLRVLLYRGGIRLYRPRAVEDLSGLEPGAEVAGAGVIVESFRRQAGGPSVFRNESGHFSPEELDASFDANFLRLMRAHPEVEFDLWFPPFSIVYYTIMRAHSEAAFEGTLACKRHVLEQAGPLPNVRVYDFQGLPEIGFHLEHYFDRVHFDATVYRFILDALATGRERATPESLAATEALLRDEATPERIERLP